MTWSLRCRCLPSALFRWTASIRRSVLPSPLRADSEFRNSGRAARFRLQHRQSPSAHDRESPLPNCRRSRCIRFHRRHRFGRRRREQRKRAHHRHCEMRAPASLLRRGCVFRQREIIRKNERSLRKPTSNVQCPTSNAQFQNSTTPIAPAAIVVVTKLTASACIR